MSVKSLFESAILEAASHDQEIGKKSWFFGEQVFLSVKNEAGVSKVSCVALSFLQRLFRIFGCFSDTHLTNVIPVLSDDKEIKPIKESASYVLNPSYRKAVKSLIRFRAECLKSTKTKTQESPSKPEATPVESALGSLIGPILTRIREHKMDLSSACKDALRFAPGVRSAVDSMKVPQEDEIARLEQESEELGNQFEKLTKQCTEAEEYLKDRYLKKDSEEIDLEKLLKSGVCIADQQALVQRIRSFIGETKKKIASIESKIKQNQEKFCCLTKKIPELKLQKFLEEIRCFLSEEIAEVQEKLLLCSESDEKERGQLMEKFYELTKQKEALTNKE